MAIYREAVCINYIALGQCNKGREACHEHYCQKCDKYYPRAKAINKNKKKRKFDNNQKLGELKDYARSNNFWFR